MKPKRIIISTAQGYGRYGDTPLDLEGLDRLRTRLGGQVSQAELIRRAVEQYLAKHGEGRATSDQTALQLSWREERTKRERERDHAEDACVVIVGTGSHLSRLDRGARKRDQAE